MSIEVSTRNLPEVKGWPAHEVNNVTAVCVPMSRKYGSLIVSQPCGPSCQVTGIAFPLPELSELRILNEILHDTLY
jgi:hypothetical protein